MSEKIENVLICEDCALYLVNGELPPDVMEEEEESTEAALVEAITYYQRRLADVESSYNSLKSRVESFVESVRDDEDDYHYCERCGSSS